MARLGELLRSGGAIVYGSADGLTEGKKLKKPEIVSYKCASCGAQVRTRRYMVGGTSMVAETRPSPCCSNPRLVQQ